MKPWASVWVALMRRLADAHHLEEDREESGDSHMETWARKAKMR